MPSLTVTLTSARNDAVRLLVAELEDALSAAYPPENRHGLPLEAIFQPHVRFFVATLDGNSAGCGGVALFDGFAEVKRMYIRPAARGQGVARAILASIEAETREANLPVLRLETGDKQTDALRLYRRYGFIDCLSATTPFYRPTLSPRASSSKKPLPSAWLKRTLHPPVVHADRWRARVGN